MTIQVSEEIQKQSQNLFLERLKGITSQIAGKAINSDLDSWLNTNCGPSSKIYLELKQSCEEGVAQGWLCNREGGGIKYGRIFKPSQELHGFSVDVVDMKDIAGPHHIHPEGEIDLIMPLEGEGLFDGRSAGWLVYEPGSAHCPTVSKGRSLVLYLLPKGAIEFTK